MTSNHAQYSSSDQLLEESTESLLDVSPSASYTSTQPRSLMTLGLPAMTEDPAGYEEIINHKQRRLLIILSISSLVIWIGSLIWGANADQYRRQSWQGDSYSRSAIGHHGFVKLLKTMGWSVRVSRYYSVHQNDQATLVSLAPEEIANQVYDNQDDETNTRNYKYLSKDALGKLFNRSLTSQQQAIVVLPKRRGVTSQEDAHGVDERWVDQHNLVSIHQAAKILQRVVLVASSKEIKITYQVQRYNNQLGIKTLSQCVAFDASGNSRPITLNLDHPQVIQGLDVKPWVKCDQGVLVGEYQGKNGVKVLLVSDSDLISNFSLPEHAPLMLEQFERFSPKDRQLLIDETGHGYKRDFSISDTLFTYPMYPLMLQIILIVCGVIYFAMSRLIPPKTKVYQLAKGKQALIEGIAALLQTHGYSNSACQRYVDHSITQVARELKLPSSLSEVELVQKLDQIATQRKLKNKLRLSHIYKQLKHTKELKNFRAERARLGVAMLTYRWKKEMIS